MTSDIPKILIMRTFNHPAERLFKAWRDPQDLGTWMWNPYDRNLEVEVDLRVGGRYRIYTDAPPDLGKAGDRWGMVGFYTEVVTNKRLAYTLHWDAPVGYNEGGGWFSMRWFRSTSPPRANRRRFVTSTSASPMRSQPAFKPKRYNTPLRLWIKCSPIDHECRNR